MLNNHSINLLNILYIKLNILTCIDNNHQIKYYYHHHILQNHLQFHLHTNLSKDKLLNDYRSNIILGTKIYNLCNHHQFLSFHLHILHRLIILSLHILGCINCQYSRSPTNMQLCHIIHYAIQIFHFHIFCNIMISLHLQMMDMLNRYHQLHNILINIYT
ncbi:unnamed protein product [Paramecium octaurelia]|uniref:Uncharacterized protein n=1 Tax=Paramecium octaurelia TaxID=43137 RepID=A0A8S1Y7Q3_PAROT|nr:unnamed protein product [Paramecium octaurelia]